MRDLINVENFVLRVNVNSGNTYFTAILRGETVATVWLEDIAENDQERCSLLFPSPQTNKKVLSAFKDFLDKPNQAIDMKALASMYPRSYKPFYTYGNDALLRVDCILAVSELETRTLMWAETTEHPNYKAWQEAWNSLSATECQVYRTIHPMDLSMVIWNRQYMEK